MTEAGQHAFAIRRRLEKEARGGRIPLDRLIQNFAVERFLYRLAQTPWSERLIIKGAVMLRVWNAPAARPTRDIDFLGSIDNSPEAVVAVVEECLAAKVPEDGLTFEPNIEATQITLEGRYPGIRCVLRGELAGARFKIQLDVGIGDAAVPSPQWVDYPTILDMPSPRVLAYAPATSIAEKFQTMVEWGVANSRMKDFYDVWLLAGTLEFDGGDVADALRATFASRGTPLPSAPPPPLTSAFMDDATARSRWTAFVTRAGVEDPPDLGDVVRLVAEFLMPAAAAAAVGATFKMSWRAGGPWVAR